MKKVVLSAVVCIFVLIAWHLIVQYIFSNPIEIDVGQVESIKINAITFEAERNPEKIAEFIKIYNKARVSNNDGYTTPVYMIEIRLKNGEKIDMQGTTQGFHFVNDGEKWYKISSAEMTYYLRDLVK